MREIPLTKGKVALIDDGDFDRVIQNNWIAVEEWPGIWYAISNRPKGSHPQKFRLHRFILQAPQGVQVDHRNGDGLDNRKENLRLATPSQNQQNRHNLSLNTSGYRGVTWHKKCQKWQSVIKLNGKNYYLGLYINPESAASAYDLKVIELFGEFARLNFPERRRAT